MRFRVINGTKILFGRARLWHNLLCLPSLFRLRALTFSRKIESGLDGVSPYREWEALRCRREMA
jgi:hypothetical protein